MHDRPKLEWVPLKIFVDMQSDFAMRLQYAEGVGRPQYSVELGKMRGDMFMRYQRIQYNTDRGTVNVREFYDLDAIGRLMDEVKVFVQQEQQRREDSDATKPGRKPRKGPQE
jgi:hypothetical protein